ncbi:hypothetical protein [Microseira sp. BLCC-F43]|jgi:energy-coupling factor transporter ATP-binding protein EcfA2|uniref:nSTAND1 domain-containing NTPase n=1 Tax=Microseira sp. BLCC-F43 TaxID=3153602 RepID=UPI0035B8E928
MVQQLYDKNATLNQVFTVVLGISGSGKSSLVKAGLIRLLRHISKPDNFEVILASYYILTLAFIKAFPKIKPGFLFPSSKFIPINYANQWEILTPMRPGESPFLSLARTILPLANVSVPTELAELDFITEVVPEKIKLLETEIADSTKENGKESQQTKLLQEEKEKFSQIAEIWHRENQQAKLLSLLHNLE